MSYNTPILMLVFNRPSKTKRVFEVIKMVKPKRLYIAADGARNNEEKLLVNKTREVFEKLDWDCQVKSLFRNENLGCKRAVSEGIDWFFENEEMGIILEDDCLPKKEFFQFAEEMLKMYKDDPRVSSISGSNPFNDGIKIDESYFFSRYNRVWGWASWREAWQHYDVDMKMWPAVKEQKLHYAFFNSIEEVKHYENIWDLCYQKQIDTWDYQWYFHKRLNSSFTLVSNSNLISNIGFDGEGTHTLRANKNLALEHGSLSFPLKHPKYVFPHYLKDEYTRKYRGQSWIKSLKRKIRSLIK